MKSYNEPSYFSKRLKELLTTSFPEKSEDIEFISRRSAKAEMAYKNAYKAGHKPPECFAIADNTLFEGLYFSKYDTILQIVTSEFEILLVNIEQRSLALRILPVCEPIFANYNLTDDFCYSPLFVRLYEELTEFIETWIAENLLLSVRHK